MIIKVGLKVFFSLFCKETVPWCQRFGNISIFTIIPIWTCPPFSSSQMSRASERLWGNKTLSGILYSTAATSCRLSFPGSHTGCSMGTHTHISAKQALQRRFSHHNSKWIISARTDLSFSIYSSPVCSVTHPTNLLCLFWPREASLFSASLCSLTAPYVFHQQSLFALFSQRSLLSWWF